MSSHWQIQPSLAGRTSHSASSATVTSSSNAALPIRMKFAGLEKALMGRAGLESPRGGWFRGLKARAVDGGVEAIAGEDEFHRLLSVRELGVKG